MKKLRLTLRNGGCFGVLGAESPALKNFAFFYKNNLILGLRDGVFEDVLGLEDVLEDTF